MKTQQKRLKMIYKEFCDVICKKHNVTFEQITSKNYHELNSHEKTVSRLLLKETYRLEQLEKIKDEALTLKEEKNKNQEN